MKNEKLKKILANKRKSEMDNTNDDSEKKYEKLKKHYEKKYRKKHKSKQEKVINPGGGGGIFIKIKKQCEVNLRSCMQDAVINVGKLFGYELKDDLYKEVPPQIAIDTDFHKVKKAVCIKNFLIFNKVPIDGSVRLDGKPFKGGPEWYVFTEIWEHGGKYIIIAKNTNKNTGRVENHAFVYNVDYVGSDDNFHNDLPPIIWWDQKTDMLL